MLQPKKKQKAIEAPGTQVAETKEQNLQILQFLQGLVLKLLHLLQFQPLRIANQLTAR